MTTTTIVACVECSALRRSDVPECFCGATEIQPAPPPKKNPISTRDAA